MKKRYFLNLIIVLAVALSSCGTYQQSIYFQGIDRNPDKHHKVENYSATTIQTGDVIGVDIKCLNPDAAAIFNTGGSGGVTSGSGASAAASTGSGYVVDDNGEISIPLLHKIKVIGMTIPEVEATLLKAVLPFVKEPVVSVHLLNFRITILGDVNSPNTFSVSTEHISIPQALSLAGDMTITARRDNVLLIREINGERKYINIDMTSAKLFESPYYYLKSNDMLYVEATRGKFSANSQFKQNLPIVLSLLSTLFLAFEIAHSNKL